MLVMPVKCVLPLVALLLVEILLSECLVFENTNLDLYHPAVSEEVVRIDCSTDNKHAVLQLIRRDQKTGKETVLQPDNLRLTVSGQEYTVLISDDRDAGEYICRAKSESITIQKSKFIFIGGKVLGGIPTKPVIRRFATLVQQGKKLAIKCSTKWYFAKLTWTKDGTSTIPRRWVTKERKYYENGNIIVASTLVIADVTLKDAGTYTCLSTSRSDTFKRSSASVQVKVKAQALYWLEDSPATFNHLIAVSGSSASLSCAMSHPAEKVSFYRKVDGSPPTIITPNSERYQLINNQELVIRKVSLLDYGAYLCRSKNYHKDKRIQLFVNSYTEAIPYVKVSPKQLHLDFYAKDKVTCTTYGLNAKIEWLRSKVVGDQTKFEDATNTIANANNTPQGRMERTLTLLFRNATQSDGGKYMCKVTINGTAEFKELTVNVKAPLSPEIKRFVSQRTKENKQVNMYCKSKGAPRPSIKFFKDGGEITSNTPGYKVTSKGKRLTVLRAKFPDHDGLYTCRISNMFGRASAVAKLMVTVPPMLDKSKEIVVVGGAEQLQVSCNIKQSNPVPSITWEYQPWPCISQNYTCKPIDSKWQKPHAKDVTPHGLNTTMTSTFVVPTSKVRRFFIRCLAKHAYGQDSHNIIGVIDKRDARKLLHTSPPGIVANEKQPLALTCTGAAGLFVNLTWYKDSTPILPNVASSITVTKRGSILEEQVSVLKINEAKPEHSGIYRCVAVSARSQEGTISSESKITIRKIYPAQVISLTSTQSVMDGEMARIKCDVDGHPAVNVSWYKDGDLLDNIMRSIPTIDDCDTAASGSYFHLTDNANYLIGRRLYELVICKTAWKVNNGTYTCKASNDLGKHSKTLPLLVYAKPIMQFVQLAKVFVDSGSDYSTNCSSEGNPTPVVWWERKLHGGYIAVTKNSTNGISWLNLPGIKEEFGSYRCVADNGLEGGRVVDQMEIMKVRSHYSIIGREAKIAYMTTSIVAGIIIVLLVTVFSIILYRRKRLYGGFYVLSIPPPPDYFRTLDHTKSISEQVHKLPYFPEWEFPREKVQMKNQVGSGAFGEVYVADAVGIIDFDPRYKIALKHKPLFSRERFSFLNFQKGDNDQRRKSQSEDGTMESMKSNKGKKSSKHKTMLVAVKKLKEDATSVEYQDLISEMKILIHIGQQENVVNLLAACTKGMEKDTMVILEYCTHGNLLSFMKGRRQIFKPIWSKQRVGMEDEFTTFDLCVAAYQISKGLEFLASRKCVHRDVAARNVLVGDNYIMKVADFGLARDIYHDNVYVKQTGGLLPFKWMAIESIVDRAFTHQSDVWAYGVLLWELMTLGGSPYPGIDHQYLSEYLHDGNRMDQPQFCPNEIYLLMRDCWKDKANERPTFDNIVIRLARVIESHCTNPEMLTYYLDKSHVSGGSDVASEDYLKAVDGGPVGSYKFSPPPTYSQSFEDRRLDSDSDGERNPAFQRQPSERYVPEKRFVDPSVAGEESVDGYEQAVDEADHRPVGDEENTQTYVNDRVDHPPCANEKTYINEDNLYVNDRLNERLPSIEEHRILITDNEDELDENTALLTDNNILSDEVETNNNNNNKNDSSNTIKVSNNDTDSNNETKYEHMNGEPCYVNDDV